MSEVIKVVITATIGGLVGIVSSFITAHLKAKELEEQFQFKIKELERNFEYQQSAEKNRERTKIKIQYLNPLRVAASDLLERISDIKTKIAHDESRIFVTNTFTQIKNMDRDKKEDFAQWCNGFGHYSMSTLYTTAIYFSHASRIRIELPFIELEPTDDQSLLDHLSEVRKAFGGEFNLWETIQDSLGGYLRKADGTVMNYKEFCNAIIDKSEYIWFLRLIDFYRDIHMKHNEIPKIGDALSNLIRFLDSVPCAEPA